MTALAWSGEVHPVAELFPMLPDAEMAALAESIRRDGLHHPVVLDESGCLLDGRNRLAACGLAGVEPTFTVRPDGGSVVGWIVAENVDRRHLDTIDRALLGVELLPAFEEEARERQRQSGEDFGRGGKVWASRPRPFGEEGPPGSEPATEPTEPRRARDDVAAAVGSSSKSIARAKRLKEQAPDLYEQVQAKQLALLPAERILRDRIAETALAEQDPDLAEKVRAGEMTLNDACNQIKPPTTTKRRKHRPSEDAARIARIEELSAKGYTSPQIAADLGIKELPFRHWCRDHDVPPPPADAQIGSVRRIDPDRVIATVVDRAEPPVELIDLVDYSTLDRDQLAHWESSLTQSISSLTTIRNNLRKELSRG